jgi:hypothetical protein
MHQRDRWLMPLGIGLLVGQAVLLWSARTLPAQPRTREAPRAYQYVGLERTIARVDPATGKIEILFKKGEPAASVLMPDSRPWEWRDVKVRESAPEEERPERKPDGDDESKRP